MIQEWTRLKSHLEMRNLVDVEGPEVVVKSTNLFAANLMGEARTEEN